MHHQTSAAKPDPFFGFNLILGPIFRFKRVGLALRIQKRVQLGRVDLKFGFNPIMFLINPIPTRPVFGSGWALRVQNQNRVELGRVGPQNQNSGQIRVGLVGFIWPHYIKLYVFLFYVVVLVVVVVFGD